MRRTRIGFGGPVLKSGDPVERLKQVKYMDLVANAVMRQNLVKVIWIYTYLERTC